MTKILRALTNKIFIVAMLILIQFVLVIQFARQIIFTYNFIYVLMMVLSTLLVVVVVNRDENPSYALAWSVVILVFPPLGAVIYLIIGGRRAPKLLRERISDTFGEDNLVQDDTIMQELKAISKRIQRQTQYIINGSDYPVFRNRNARYLKSGEIKFEVMLQEIEKAERFIFLEYFIIKDGYMWQTLLELLKKKVNQGVDVRLIYDDWGCATFTDLQKQCRDAGIDVVTFNPIVPKLAIQMNNRSHRKACIVDGRSGIVGGLNLADEYINKIERFGHWKDTAVFFEGEAVHALTSMFLQFYQYYTGIKEDPENYRYHFEEKETKGYIQAFSDAPTDEYDLGLASHLNLINNATEYIYIQTPYLIVGYEMIQALKNAATSGVDVRIIVPGIPDKVMVNQVTKSNYESLIKGGVKVYEYTPGFVHSKTMVADDKICTVGTTNMDFRSYYLHFESTVVFVDNDVVMDCKQDALDTFEVSKLITLEDVYKTPYLARLLRGFMNIFSGLL